MRRRYGQHFLKDARILARIVDASGVGPDDAALEIGPGAGDLTRALAGRARKVLSVEIDRRLHAILLERGLPENVELRLGDALRLTDADIEEAFGGAYRLVSNLPYEITSKTLEKFLSEVARKPESVTLMLQREVGERIIAKGGMNRLALFCGYHAEKAELLFMVPRGAFSPPPAVESCVVRLIPRKVPLLDPAREQRLFRLAAAVFSEKRKQIRNSAKGLLGPETDRLLTEAGISPDARPEDIPFEDWLRLASKM